MTVARVIESISTEIRANTITLHDLYVLMDNVRQDWSDDAVCFQEVGGEDQRAIALVASVLDVIARELEKM